MDQHGKNRLQVKPIRGLNTAWNQIGKSSAGKPLLFFIHGFPDGPEVWDSQVSYFSPSHLVITPYARGRGQSEAASDLGRYELDSVTLDYLEILRYADPKRQRPVVVIGHDIGSIYAWSLARALGARLHSLIILNGVSLDQMAKRLTRHPHQILKSWYIAAFQIPLLPELILNQWKIPLIKWARRGEKQTVLAGDEQLDMKSAISPYRANFKHFLKQRFAQYPPIEAPVLILFGKNDPSLEIPTSEEIQASAKNFTIRVLNSNHWVQLDDPKRVNRLIDEFIQTKNESRNKSKNIPKSTPKNTTRNTTRNTKGEAG